MCKKLTYPGLPHVPKTWDTWGLIKYTFINSCDKLTKLFSRLLCLLSIWPSSESVLSGAVTDTSERKDSLWLFTIQAQDHIFGMVVMNDWSGRCCSRFLFPVVTVFKWVFYSQEECTCYMRWNSNFVGVFLCTLISHSKFKLLLKIILFVLIKSMHYWSYVGVNCALWACMGGIIPRYWNSDDSKRD